MNTVAASTTDADYTNFILAQLHVAATRARLMVNEVDSIELALTTNFIDADQAPAWAVEVGVFTSSAIAIPAST